jgi:hypothetical protein
MSKKFICKIDLSPFETPKFWVNFFQTIISTKMMTLNGIIQHINNELKPYNAKYIYGEPSALEFESEQDYVYFLLRWS